ncbi:retrovirus polyprotein, putative, partial [Perkinsus marinus ATCC 50983]
HQDPSIHEGWKVYLNTTRAREWALYRSHSHPLLAAHQGAPRAWEALWKAGYVWDTMVADVRRGVSACHECQMGKPFAKEPAQPLVRKRNSGRFTNVQIDFLTKPNDVKLGGPPELSPGGWQYLCVLMDEGTRVALAVPSFSTSTRDVIQALLQWCACYGVPSVLQMDMAGAHQSQELAMFLRMMGISLRPGVPRRPQSQGMIERLIRDVKSSIHTAQADRRGYTTP